MRAWQWVIPAASFVSLALIAATLVFSIRVLSIGTAYKAKMLCSDVFVAGRLPQEALADLEVDDLKPLSIVEAKVDRNSHTAAATTLFGAIAYRAQFRGDTGCSLVFSGVSRPSVAGTTWSRPGYPLGSPADDLPTVTDRRLDPILDAAFAEPDPQHLRRTRAIVVIQDGHIVGERYGRGIAGDTPLLGWSMTKSIMNALVGILVKDGRLSLDGAARVDGWSRTGDARARITLDHLMHMSSGLRFDEGMTSPLTDVTSMLLRSPDMAAFAADRPLEVAPGARWQYSSGTSIIIAGIMRNALDDEEYPSISSRCPVRATWDAERRPRNRFERHLRRLFVHVCDGSRLGALRPSVPEGRDVERRAPSAGGLGRLHEKTGACGPASRLWRSFLAANPTGIRQSPRACSRGRLSCGRPRGPVRDHHPVPASRDRSSGKDAATDRRGIKGLS